MKETQITQFLNDLFGKEITKPSYSGGGTFSHKIVDKDGRVIIEQAIRSFLLDNREEQIGLLEAKVFTYERIISNSNFAPMILPKEIDTNLTIPKGGGEE